MSKQNLVVGIGSAQAGDSLGWQVAMRIQQRPTTNCDVRIALAPADILDWLESFQTVHICDACSGIASQPTIHRWRWPDAQVERLAWGGTHDLSLPAVLDLATTLGLAPAEFVLWGIEVPRSVCEADNTSAFQQIIADAAERIARELEQSAQRCAHA